MVLFVPRGPYYEPESYHSRQRRLSNAGYPSEPNSASSLTFDCSTLISVGLNNISKEVSDSKPIRKGMTEEQFNKKDNPKKESWFDELIDFLTIYK